MLHRLVVTCPLYCEDLVSEELEELGLFDRKILHGAVKAKGTLEQAYRVCLWSRIGNKVLLTLLDFEAEGKAELIERLSSFPFPEHFSAEQTFLVESLVSHSFLSNANYANLLVKDAVADSFRRARGRRPNVADREADVRFHLFLEGERGSLSVVLSPPALFKRSYRKESVAAPLKENVAAAVLRRAGWKEIGEAGGALIDLMCGAGTFLFEALLISGGIAPAALHPAADPDKWSGHDLALWRRLLKEASESRNRMPAGLPLIIGYDIAEEAVARAQANLRQAGFERLVRVKKVDFRDTRAPGAPYRTGLVVANPPYGRRLGDPNLVRFYGDLGLTLSREYAGYRAAILAGDRELARAVGLRAEKLNTLYNGPIRCTLAHFNLNAANQYRLPS